MALTGRPGAATAPGGSVVQPVVAGLLAATVGFASTFTLVLAGFSAVGASPAQAASGLMVVSIVQGMLSIALSLWWRLPVGIVWSTPASALLLATGAQAGGYPAAVGGFIVAALLIVAAGLIRPFGRLVQAIPIGLANAMLAGILFEICLAPVQAAKAAPGLMLPIIAAWALSLRFARRWAVPITVAVTAVLVVIVTRLPPGALAGAWPSLVVTWPRFESAAIAGFALPLFVVTMASQNIPGLTVLRANGYRPNLAAIFVATGLAGVVTALGSGHLINLAAVTAALCAGPDAHPDPARRYWSTVAGGSLYVVLGLSAALAAAFVAAAPPALVQAVAGLALMGTLAGALAAALAQERDRLPVIVTFVTAASGLTVLGIGASFWGLLAGGVLMAVDRLPGGGAARPVTAPAPGADPAAQPAGGVPAARK